MAFKILSCDGGGIRGLITALLIQDLDTKFGIVANADGFVGTSTGGLLALGLSTGVPIGTIVDVYLNQGSTVFTPNGWLLDDKHKERPLGASATDLSSGPGYFSCAYVASGLKQIAQQLVGNALMSSAKKFVAVNSAQLWDSASRSWIPCTISNGPSNAYRNITMVDAALATSAAPTYFPPHRVMGAGYDYGFFADGGVFANNPSMTAVTELLYQKIVPNLASLRMLSLGTGDSPQGIPPSAIGDPLNWGVTSWLYPWSSGANGVVPAMALLNLTMDATAELAAVQTGQVLGGAYQRGNVPLNKPYPLDNWQDVDVLVQATSKYMNTPTWQSVRNWVKQNWQ
ncbi:patatin [Dyella lipolytica]|uniref:Patatin-like phospholipase family protein n=1 Tax=Dyella lipolytica TaxID=1867835 RepID=A0ABW8IYE0_9GAMM|nr:patatin-like phospholipase family protein [Dyella lipolytica]GLQ47835.1 patatin [Dyella lipolytica]